METRRKLENKLFRADYDIALSIFEDNLPYSKKISIVINDCNYLEMYKDLGTFILRNIIKDANERGWQGGYYPVSLKYHEIDKGKLFSGFVYLYKDNREIGTAGFVEIDKERRRVTIKGKIFSSHEDLPEKVFNEIYKRLEKIGKLETR